MILPSFNYRPDPLATGSFEERDIKCVCCGELRAYVYVGSIYAEADLEGKICPWCIKSGLAHEKFGAEFTDLNAVGDYESVPLPLQVKEEVAHRTPGFNGWQQERWLAHCGDACAFLGPAGKQELANYDSKALIESIRTDLNLSDSAFTSYLDKLDIQSGPTAYVFRCLHCGQFQGYSDF